MNGFHCHPGTAVLFRNLDVGVDCDSRIALVGPNGSGKSTLLKLMAGELEATEGSITRRNGLVLGRYHQHSAEMLDMSQSAFDFFRREFPPSKLSKLGQYQQQTSWPSALTAVTVPFPGVWVGESRYRTSHCNNRHLIARIDRGRYPQGMTDEEWRGFIGKYGLSGDLQVTNAVALRLRSMHTVSGAERKLTEEISVNQNWKALRWAEGTADLCDGHPCPPERPAAG